MNPVDFQESNALYGPPHDLTESQCRTIPAFQGQVIGGSVDGTVMVVVAWKPEPHELARLNQGEPIFLTFLGGLPPHYLSTSFKEATNPA